MKTLQRIVIVTTVSLWCYALFLSYCFSTHYYDMHERNHTMYDNVKPLQYEGRVMAQPWAVKVVNDRRYLQSWFISIGHAEATMIIWTPWARL